MPHVTVVWADRSQTEVRADQALDSFEARRWLDEQFVALDCEPLRASGKVLVADKLLAVAATAGTGLFADSAWATQFAKVASGASARENVRIDIAEGTVSF